MLNATLLAAILAFQSITASMEGMPAATAVSGGVINITGQQWATSQSFSMMGEVSLGGYSVSVGGQAGLLTLVDGQYITVIVPELPAGTHTVAVSGPAGAFSTNVEVVAVYPIINERDGYAVASLAQNFYPLDFTGEPIPVSPMTYNYIGIQARGIPIGAYVTVRLDGPEQHTWEAKAYPMPGFHGTTNVLAFSDPCLNGTYALTLSVNGVESPPSLIKFSSDCAVRRVDGFARPRVVR